MTLIIPRKDHFYRQIFIAVILEFPGNYITPGAGQDHADKVRFNDNAFFRPGGRAQGFIRLPNGNISGRGG
jgi:hypothetical protein